MIVTMLWILLNERVILIEMKGTNGIIEKNFSVAVLRDGTGDLKKGLSKL